MKKTRSLQHLMLAILLSFFFQNPRAQNLPNIIIVYADDLGFGDLSCYNTNAAYYTPNLDRLAAEGIRFTDAHSPSTICSPSRYGLYSGQIIYRSTGRGGGAFEGPGGPSYLKPGTLTLGGMLQSKGYRTGVFGKWHVGLTWLDQNGNQLAGGFENSLLIDYSKSTPLIDGPNNRGFDESFVTPNCPTTDPLYIYIENGMVSQPASLRHDSDRLPNPDGKWRWDNDEGWMAPGYNFMEADLLFYKKTEEFIREHRKNSPDRPFFAVLSTQIAHAPVLPAAEFNGATPAGPRGDFVWELDVLVGRLLDLLTELGIDKNTLILFNADNGAETVHVDWMRQDYQHDASGGWRGMKRDGWEGGHRVPFIAWWPEVFKEGLVTRQMINTTDIFATLASVVGYTLKDEDARDSYDFLPVMLGIQDENQPVRPYMLTQSFRGEFQIRQGPWKYLDHRGSGGNNYEESFMKKYQLPDNLPDAPGQLYHLVEDPGEKINLYFEQEQKRAELKNLLEELKSGGRSAPTNRQPLGIQTIRQISSNNRHQTTQDDPIDPVREPVMVTPGQNQSPPSDAVILFARDSLSQFVSSETGGPPTWKVEGDYFTVEPGSHNIETKQRFRDCQLHIEWKTDPQDVVDGKTGQQCSNSGIYLMSKFEIQVLDSYQNKTSPEGQAAAFYGEAEPLVNASLKPGEWQSYDLIFKAPSYNEREELLEAGSLTVFHNGVLVQNQVAVRYPTASHNPNYKLSEVELPLMLQDHQSRVSYRNIWIRKL